MSSTPTLLLAANLKVPETHLGLVRGRGSGDA
jgi:hypothetical protein